MLKKIMCLCLAAACVLSFASCGKKDDNNGSSKKTDKAVTSGGIKEAKVDDDDAVLKTKLATADFGGKDYTFYYWYETNEIINRKVAAFNKAHNANISVKIGTGGLENDVAKSIAEGKPYDLIANHGMFFPQSIFSDLYEPLDGYIDELDYFNVDKPNNGGLSKTVNEAFTWNGKLYAAGSAKSVYSYVFYYNKKAFADAGLEDPYTLWKQGNWTWDKVKEMSAQVTDIANNIAFFANADLFPWLNQCGVSAVKVEGQKFTENLGDTAVMNAINSYASLFFGDNPMCLTTHSPMETGKSIATMAVSDAFTVYAKNAKASSAFDKDASNLGACPVPTGLTAGGKYPAHVAQGYSAAKGAKDPSIAAAYALFESRTEDSDVGSSLQLPADVRNYVDEQFAKNGFLGFQGLQDSEGKRVSDILGKIAEDIKAGADVASTVSAQRNTVTRIIADCLSRAK